MNDHPANDLRVSLVQGDTRWHDPSANRAYYGELIHSLKGITDLVILPETFTSGFSNDSIGTAEDMQGETVQWLQAQAKQLNAAVCGSVQIRDKDGVYNRLLFATPDGALAQYDKRHLFTYAKEHERYAAGRERITVTWRGWRICPLVCYDLRFPVFSRNGFGNEQPDAADYDLLLYVANWPGVRAYPWKALLRARAIENVCYVAAVNRVGTDGNGLDYAGDSSVIDFLGHPVSELADRELVVTTTLQAAELRKFRAQFPALRDGDGFTLR